MRQVCIASALLLTGCGAPERRAGADTLGSTTDAQPGAQGDCSNFDRIETGVSALEAAVRDHRLRLAERRIQSTAELEHAGLRHCNAAPSNTNRRLG